LEQLELPEVVQLELLEVLGLPVRKVLPEQWEDKETPVQLEHWDQQVQLVYILPLHQ
jgi:hypothetical protein